MTDARSDRPASLPSRPRPVPAPGRRDPMDAPAPAPAPASTPAPVAAPIETAKRTLSFATRRGSEPTTQIGTRVALDVRELLEAAAEREGITLRKALEKAVRQTWG